MTVRLHRGQYHAIRERGDGVPVTVQVTGRHAERDARNQADEYVGDVRITLTDQPRGGVT